MIDSGHGELTRRKCLAILAFVPGLPLQLGKDGTSDDPLDWSCPMDPDVHSGSPGKCPRCGMTLTMSVPDRVEFPLSLSVAPRALHPGGIAKVSLRVITLSGKAVSQFELVHEKLIHLFVVSEDLEFFAHVHPELQADGSFLIAIKLAKPGMYRLLADYYPKNATPQLAEATLFVEGKARRANLDLARTRQTSENLSASLRLEPEQLLVGLQARLYYSLEPFEGLEKYLGAWGHMLVVSEDLIDMIHLHPFLAGGAVIQYNVIFPRAGNYKVWSQFQRLGVVNTVAFSVNVAAVSG